MTKQNQILAIEKSVKTTVNKEWTEAYKKIQKPDLFLGRVRTYAPLNDEDTDKPPGESQRVQINADKLLHSVSEEISRMFDITATKDKTNCSAVADIKLEDGTVLLAEVPVTFLLWLEKQLTDIHTFIEKLPILDPTDDWTWDEAQAYYRSNASSTQRTKKVPRSFSKAKATDKHPEQVEVFQEDIPVGTWTTVKFSGALQQDRVNLLKDRVEKLQEAVKFAREEANSIEVTDLKAGQAIFGYLLA